MNHLANRKSRLMPRGVPRWVRCYDNGGKTADRFTVCFTGKAGAQRAPGYATEYSYRAMSADPFHPQGFGMWGSAKNQPADTMGEKSGHWYWPPAMGRKIKHLGTRISFSALPPDCRKLVRRDYREIWDL